MALTFTLSETQRALHAYWQRQRGTNAMPRVVNVNLSEVPAAVPSSIVLEAIGTRLRYVRAGSTVCEVFGSDPTGRFLDDIIPEKAYALAARSYALVIDRGRPLISSSMFVSPRGGTARVARLLLPATDDDTRVAIIIGCLTFFPNSERPKQFAGAAGEAGQSKFSFSSYERTNGSGRSSYRAARDPAARRERVLLRGRARPTSCSNKARSGAPRHGRRFSPRSSGCRRCRPAPRDTEAASGG